MNYSYLLKNCTLCVRNCNVNRLNNQKGFCKTLNKLLVARADLHMWEEPCISGTGGSGTVFFSNCNLQCVFCQNHCISQEGKGLEITVERLAEIFLELQLKGAHNINLVTPTHYTPLIIEALKIAKSNQLNIPIIYNTNGYDSIETIKMLKGYIDVYLPDFKYFDNKYAKKYSNAPDYKDNLLKILPEMISQVGDPKFEDGLIKRGVIIRHLLLPKSLFDSKKIVDHIYSTYKDKVYISLMNQYTPMYKAYDYPELSTSVSSRVYDSLLDYAISIGITQGFIQGEGTNTDKYTPEFNFKGIVKKSPRRP